MCQFVKVSLFLIVETCCCTVTINFKAALESIFVRTTTYNSRTLTCETAVRVQRETKMLTCFDEET